MSDKDGRRKRFGIGETILMIILILVCGRLLVFAWWQFLSIATNASKSFERMDSDWHYKGIRWKNTLPSEPCGFSFDKNKECEDRQ